MSQLTIEHQADGSFHIVRFAPDHKSVRIDGTITPPTAFDVPGTPGAHLDGELRWLLEKYLDYPFEPRTHQAARAAAALQVWGEAAFHALFHAGEARDFYQRASAAGLDRLRLVISSDDPKVLSWPWEALYDPTRQFIAHHCDIERKLTRDVDDPPELPATLPRDRINILLVTCRPEGDRDVGYRSVSRPMIDKVHASDLPAEVTVLRPPTLEQLDRVLAERPGYFHVLHFDGHGAYGHLAGGAAAGPQEVLHSPHIFAGPQGCLVFEKSDGTADLVPGWKLDQLLRTHKLPAVVINACQSAMVDGDAQSAFASVAASLIHAGTRSVLAMAYSLYVTGAQRFLPAFYEALFRTGSFASATRGGRRAMLAEKGRVCAVGNHDLDDWLVPVLYQQQPFEFSFAKTEMPGSDPGAGTGKTVASALRVTRLPTEARLDQVEYGFVGRDGAILKLERGLLAPAPVLLVHGLGGAGKTTLARGFADWLDKTRGLDACRWFAFDGIHSAEFVLDEIGAIFFPPEFKTRPVNAKIEQLAKVLGQHRVLLIWDNFESASGNVDAGIAPLLKPEDLALLKCLLVRMRGGKSKVILTSRGEEEQWLPTDLRRKFDLGGLRDEERWEFCDLIALTLGLKINRKDPELTHLLDLLEGHPLLMRVVLPTLEGSTVARVTERLLANGIKVDDRTTATLQFVEERLPRDLQMLLTPLALHERFVSVDHVVAMATQAKGLVVERVQVERFCQSMAKAGLLQHRANSIYHIHPSLSRHLRAPQSIAHADPHQHQWRRAFITLMARGADEFAPKPFHEQINVFSVHEGNFRAALTMAIEDDLNEPVAALLQTLASYAHNARHWTEAETLYNQLAEHGLAVKNDRLVAAAYHHIGMISEGRSNFALAESSYHKSISFSKKSGDEKAMSITYHQLGMVAWKRHDYDEAMRWSRKSLAIKEGHNDDNSKSHTYYLIGAILGSQREFDLANEWLHKSLAISDKLGDRYSASGTHHQLGIIAHARGDLANAEAWYKKALEGKQNYGTPIDVANVLHQLGVVAHNRNDLAQAEEWYIKAIAISAKYKDQHGEALTCHQLGRVFEDRRDFVHSVEWYNKSLTIKTMLGDEHGKASTHHQLGIVAQRRGDLNQAKEAYLKSLEICEKFRDEHGAAQTFCAMGVMELDRGAPSEAMRLLVLAARAFSKAKNPPAANDMRQFAGEKIADPAARTLWPAGELGPLPEPKPG